MKIELTTNSPQLQLCDRATFTYVVDDRGDFVLSFTFELLFLEERSNVVLKSVVPLCVDVRERPSKIPLFSHRFAVEERPAVKLWWMGQLTLDQTLRPALAKAVDAKRVELASVN
jgi:hypothetical protein